jgi:hypothetical protein
VVAGSGGTILNSPDGGVWAPAFSGVNQRIEKVIYDEGIFVGLAGVDGLVTSTDGVAWTVHPAPGASIRDISFCGHSFYGVNDFGNILRTGFFGPPLLKATRAGSRVQISLQGEVARIYRLQAATGLEPGDWHDVLTFTNFDPVVLLLETNSPTSGRQFFRVMAP